MILGPALTAKSIIQRIAIPKSVNGFDWVSVRQWLLTQKQMANNPAGALQ